MGQMEKILLLMEPKGSLFGKIQAVHPAAKKRNTMENYTKILTAPK